MLNANVLILVTGLLAIGACKPRDYNSGDVAGAAGGRANASPCKSESTWKAELCGADKTQVIVTKVLPVSSDLKNKLQKDGVNLCFGQVLWYSPAPVDQSPRFKWNESIGVWLGTLGCHKGVGYKLASSGFTGQNVVTPIYVVGLHEYAPPHDLYSPGLTASGWGLNLEKKIGIYNKELISLCTDKFAENCNIGVQNNTLYIKEILKR